MEWPQANRLDCGTERPERCRGNFGTFGFVSASVELINRIDVHPRAFDLPAASPRRAFFETARANAPPVFFALAPALFAFVCDVVVWAVALVRENIVVISEIDRGEFGSLARSRLVVLRIQRRRGQSE